MQPLTTSFEVSSLGDLSETYSFQHRNWAALLEVASQFQGNGLKLAVLRAGIPLLDIHNPHMAPIGPLVITRVVEQYEERRQKQSKPAPAPALAPVHWLSMATQLGCIVGMVWLAYTQHRDDRQQPQQFQ